MKKLLVVVLIIIAFIIFEWAYNLCYNATKSIKDLEDRISNLISTSKTVSYLSNVKSIEDLRYDLTQDNYTKNNIKIWFTKFLIVWRDSPKTNKIDTLTTETAKEYEKNNIELFTPVLKSVKNIGNNQTLCLIFILIIFSAFLLLAFYSNILRDIISDPILKQQIQSQDNFPPFSLSRTQLAIWITIIACFYLHSVLWNNCTLTDSINTTALILMGISAGTFATGAIIDTIEIEQGTPRNQNQLSSGNFFTDILSDSQGISINRFQNVVWTIVAVIVYFYAYNNNITKSCLPELNSTLLALTGISSATYLTLKTRENIFSEVKIHLIFESSISSNKSIVDSQGWMETKVTVQDATGMQSTAIPDATSKYDFVIRGLNPGNYSISVSAKANINGTESEFIGNYNGVINSTSAQPIVITINKK